MLKYIGIAILLVIVLCLIYYVYCDTPRKRARRAIRSNGTFDAAARRALDELTAMPNPTTEDQFQRAGIIRYNLLEGNVRERQNRPQVRLIARDYTNILHRMVDRPVDNPEFMLHQIGGFYDDMFGLQFAQVDAGFDEEDRMLRQIIGGLGAAFMNTAPKTRATAVADRRRQAAQQTTAGAAVDTYFDLSTNFTDDGQNVHDGQVNNYLRGVYNKLRDSATGIDLGETLAEIDEFLDRKYDGSRARRDAAVMTLTKMKSGDTIMTFNAREDHILAYTWERCNHPRNRAAADNMKTAIVDALADSVENGSLVCTNGRCGRVLNSLATLDFDPTMNGAMTFEAYRNRIFQETRDIFDREIEAALRSHDPEIQRVGASFDNPDAQPSAEALLSFKDNIKREIDANVEAYNNLSDADKQTIKAECYVATEF